MRLGMSVASLATLSFVGCASAPERPSAPSWSEALPWEHMIALDSLGRVRFAENGISSAQPCKGHLLPDASEGVFEEACKRPPWIEQIFTRFAASYAKEAQAKKHSMDILLYFNGGLNSINEVLIKAATQYQFMRQDDYFPIFMIWPTGLTDTYVEQAYHVINGVRYDDAQTITGTGRIVTDFAVGLAHLFGDWTYSTRRFFNAYWNMPCEYLVYDTNLIPQDILGAYARKHCIWDGEKELRPEDYRLPSIRVRDGHESGAAANVIFSDEVNAEATTMEWERPVDVATAPSRTILLPFADGFGEQAWENMKRRTQRTVRAEHELIGDGWPWDTLRDRYPHGLGGFAQFLAILDACTVASEKGPVCPSAVTESEKTALKDARITLIGHSMGAIVINQLVQEFPGLPYRDIVFLSGAATVNQTKVALDPLLRSGREIHFYSLMLHPLNEARETNYFGIVPTGSLLIWIDEMFEHPDTQLDRTVGQWANMRGGRNAFSAEARKWMQLKIFDLAEDNAGAEPEKRNDLGWVIRSHGGYNAENAPFWRRSFWSTEHGRRCETPVRFAGETLAPVPDCPGPG